MPEVVIECEEASGTGWQFRASVPDHAGAMRSFNIRLSWADYNLWSADGSARPEVVARAALRYLLTQEPAAEWSESFDLARIRRRYPGIDDEIARLF